MRDRAKTMAAALQMGKSCSWKSGHVQHQQQQTWANVQQQQQTWDNVQQKQQTWDYVQQQLQGCSRLLAIFCHNKFPYLPAAENMATCSSSSSKYWLTCSNRTRLIFSSNKDTAYTAIFNCSFEFGQWPHAAAAADLG